MTPKFLLYSRKLASIPEAFHDYQRLGADKFVDPVVDYFKAKTILSGGYPINIIDKMNRRNVYHNRSQ